MVVNHLLLSHRRCYAIFISRDIVRQQIAPRLVRVGEYVAFGTLGYTRRLDRANVVALSIVIPCDDLPAYQF